jgi:hypothetical protein
MICITPELPRILLLFIKESSDVKKDHTAINLLVLRQYTSIRVSALLAQFPKTVRYCIFRFAFKKTWKPQVGCCICEILIPENQILSICFSRDKAGRITNVTHLQLHTSVLFMPLYIYGIAPKTPGLNINCKPILRWTLIIVWCIFETHDISGYRISLRGLTSFYFKTGGEVCM